MKKNLPTIGGQCNAEKEKAKQEAAAKGQAETPLKVEAQPAKSVEQMSVLDLIKKSWTDAKKKKPMTSGAIPALKVFQKINL